MLAVMVMCLNIYLVSTFFSFEAGNLQERCDQMFQEFSDSEGIPKKEKPM